jgi:predicted O-linked N-acetylglucosamine transferase (SPINDLY family)
MKTRPNAPCPCGSGRKYKKCHGAPGAAIPKVAAPGVADLLARGAALEAAARLVEAEQCYQRALEVAPTSAQAWAALGKLAERAGDPEAARECYARLVGFHPTHAAGHFALANVDARLFAFDRARAGYLRALEIDRGLAGAWGNLGNIEKYFGNFKAAFECYERAIDAEEDPALQARRHSNLLLALHYDEDLTHDEVYAAHREWGERHAESLYPSAPAYPNARDPDKRLRLAYVSGSFGAMEIMGHLLASVLAHHDRERYEVCLYSSTRVRTEETAKVRRHADRWVDTADMDDAAVAARIRADGIDIAIDLDGHNPTGRPLIFARRPAPVQVEWLDWFNTSGMTAIDYLVTDPYTTPEGSPQRYAETVMRLPHARLCYTIPDDPPPVAPMPSLFGTPFTFGSFNRQDKLHPPLIRLWSDILHAAPDTRLLLKNRALQIPAVRAEVAASFARHGVPAERLVLRGPTPHRAMLDEYRDIDIALDTFPYNGGLTTCECLYMGVPIVALEGERMIGRQTAAMLRLLGLDDWIASSTADYARLAVEKSWLRDEAAQLRATLRERFTASPICDAPRFARDLEALYRTMWRRYCA